MKMLPDSLQAWLDYILSIHPKNMEFGLDRIGCVADRLGLKHLDCPTILVGGTNGKGSCVRMLETMYHAAGYRVASMTSPHILKFNERCRINAKDIDDATLVAAFNNIEAAREDVRLTYFEFTTLAIFDCIKQARPDVAIIEIGMGGRLDASNILDADVAVITNIDLDHTQWLGETREAIGFEKAGIMRRGQKVVCGDPDSPQSILQVAKKIDADLYLINREFCYKVNENDWQFIAPGRRLDHLPQPKLRHQNIATSLMAAACLEPLLPLPWDTLHPVVAKTGLPGRFESFVHADKHGVLDVAHNPQACRWLAKQLQPGRQHHQQGRLLAVIGMLQDKNIVESVQPLLSLVDAWYVGGLAHLDQRGAQAAMIAAHLPTDRQTAFEQIEMALAAAFEAAKPADFIVIFGSFFTVAKAKQFMNTNVSITC